MATTSDVNSDAEHMALLDHLIAERGIDKYGLFMLTGEGLFTPDGYEETSGYALSNEGRAYFSWTGWDEAAQRTTFSMWKPTEPQSEWQDDEEYQAARVAAGLV